MDVLKQFVDRRKRGGARPQVRLAGFGKLPAWSEHVQDLGEFSPTLADLRSLLYLEGIPALTKPWDALPVDARWSFNHWLAWVRPEDLVLGRVVSSVDRVGRSASPFVVLAEVSGCPLAVALRRMTPHLDEFAQRCLGLHPASTVRAAFTSQQGVLESVLAAEASAADVQPPRAAERTRFLGLADWDAEGVALARLLYKTRSAWGDYARERGTRVRKAAEQQIALRLPTPAGELVLSVLMWEEFVSSQVHPSVPRLYVIAADGDWLDIALGRLHPNQFFGLRANRQGVVPETSVPHPTSPSLQAEARAIMSGWRRDQPLDQALPEPPAEEAAAATVAPAPTALAPDSGKPVPTLNVPCPEAPPEPAIPFRAEVVAELKPAPGSLPGPAPRTECSSPPANSASGEPVAKEGKASVVETDALAAEGRAPPTHSVATRRGGLQDAQALPPAPGRPPSSPPSARSPALESNPTISPVEVAGGGGGAGRKRTAGSDPPGQSGIREAPSRGKRAPARRSRIALRAAGVLALVGVCIGGYRLLVPSGHDRPRQVTYLATNLDRSSSTTIVQRPPETNRALAKLGTQSGPPPTAMTSSADPVDELKKRAAEAFASQNYAVALRAYEELAVLRQADANALDRLSQLRSPPRLLVPLGLVTQPTKDTLLVLEASDPLDRPVTIELARPLPPAVGMIEVLPGTQGKQWRFVAAKESRGTVEIGLKASNAQASGVTPVRLEVEPDPVAMGLELAESALKAGDFEAALRAYQDTLRHDPNQVVALARVQELTRAPLLEFTPRTTLVLGRTNTGQLQLRLAPEARLRIPWQVEADTNALKTGRFSFEAQSGRWFWIGAEAGRGWVSFRVRGPTATGEWARLDLTARAPRPPVVEQWPETLTLVSARGSQTSVVFQIRSPVDLRPPQVGLQAIDQAGRNGPTATLSGTGETRTLTIRDAAGPGTFAYRLTAANTEATVALDLRLVVKEELAAEFPGPTFAWIPFQYAVTAAPWPNKSEQGFWVCHYEVARGEFSDLMQFDPSKGPASGAAEGRKMPVDSIAADQAEAYCRKLTERHRERIPAGWQFRLPTLDEWWAFCRDTSVEGAVLSRAHASPVDAGTPSPRHLVHAIGNVAELGSVRGDLRPLLGLSFRDRSTRLTKANYNTYLDPQVDAGFRVVLAPLLGAGGR